MIMLMNQSLRRWLLAVMLAVPGLSSAHILTEANQFPDIKNAEARFDIVLLVGAGIVPETPEFGPDNKLSRADLAAWAAHAAGLLGKPAAKPDMAALAKAALDQGLVKSIEGDASYAELDAVFSSGQGRPAQADAVPTRGQAAAWLAAGLAAPVSGSLLEKTGLLPGPVGVVSAVESKTNPDGGTSTFLTIGDTTLPVYTHAKVGNGPSNLSKWKGLTARRTFIRKLGEIQVWLYLEGESLAGQTAEPAADHGSHKH